MRMKCLAGFILWAMVSMGVVWAQGSQAPLTLEESIKITLERNLTLHSAVEGVVGSEFRRKEAITNFLPWWTAEYGYTRNSTPVTIGVVQAAIPLTSVTDRDIFNFGTTLKQPVFTGGLNLANYRSAKIGVDLSKESVETEANIVL
jgi:outer membrane protein TolC